MPELRVVASELVLGSDPEAKAARAGALARAWLARAPDHRAVCVLGAEGWAPLLRARLAAGGASGERLQLTEDATELAHAVGGHGDRDVLLIADCLTLWLTARLLPAVPGAEPARATSLTPRATLLGALRACAGPVVLVGNELPSPEVATGQEGKAFLATLGSLNQAAAGACERVALVSGATALLLKGVP